ncbi:ribonuclease P protein subunit p30 isoform X1 [Gouania willdenowi]|uniref:ribonuclease P protein subunit p30 isoform X1 n=1 Tax=Gouania willdenowi TaxID=441366 RepID=UPI001055A061|nr:ribonuclease P protein subunit p30 isoform X1 [Gouania willdenowi]
MSVFMDLNVPFTDNHELLQQLIQTAAHLGYSTVAINYMFEPSAKNKQVPVPADISQLIGPLPLVQGRSRPIRVLHRLTVVVSDPAHFVTRANAEEYRPFNLLAVQLTSEKLFHTACLQYDVDIISIPGTEKLPFFFKRAAINGAADRGVVFEVSYAAALRDSTRRRYTITNALSLMESCRGRGVILCSAAEQALELRGPYDVITLYPSLTHTHTLLNTQLCVCSLLCVSGVLFGLCDADSKDCVSSSCRSVLLHAETRRTANGIVSTRRREGAGPLGEAVSAKRAKVI